MVQPVPEHINFPKEEENVIELWNKLDAFKTSLKQSKGRPRYTFYDGPPFATGLPHYGHILAGTIKDTVTRYAHQNGYHVERRFGWDCHGLPVEYEIDKTLGIKGPDDVAKMGIEKYNAECRKIVMRYSKEWQFVVTRLGRWIDFENDYKTLYPWFMETIWWVFRQLFDKGLVYRGFKVMPYSTACNTPLSNFESGQNYKDVVDPAVIVNFPLDENPNSCLIAWTTTPWTLPSNMALCVHPTMEYVKIEHKVDGKVYILLEARLPALFKKEDEYAVLEKFKGETLRGKGYKPLFEYFGKYKGQGAFQVVVDNYVTDDTGTGIVHQAPFFGADDYRVCIEHRVITKEQVICPVDETGCFTQEVPDFAGQYVKDADKNIMKMLKQNGRLVDQSTFKHSYPFCWRSETPLIYMGIPSWFVRVEELVEKLLDNNQQTYWVPEFVREKRFGNWLRDAHDWAISRNRYWGTPIPLWVSEDLEEVVCVGSIDELAQLTGTRVKDLHRESIDHLTIPSKRPGQAPLKRVPEVFDCWFESGSMPYAQQHYPFENRRDFEDNFPADFIAEGIDQTRGWFYTLLVLSTALFGKPPFKNLIANGLVLAADGSKMSKRKRNYPDPLDVVNKYGADALRLYLINSPVVRAESLRFKEEGVRDILKDVFLPWYNAYRFLMQNVDRLRKEDGLQFVYNEDKLKPVDNIMDKWILSFTQSLVDFTRKEMAAYRLYTVVPKLVRFVDKLTNWYVRSNRKRLKGEGGTDDCLCALQTLFSVLFTMVRMMAPFTPFLTELIYQNLRHLIDPAVSKGQDTNSVHYLMIPQPRSDLIDKGIENAVATMQTVIELGRVIRDRKTLPLKYPLHEVVVIHQEKQVLEDTRSLEKYILEELNVRQLTTSKDKEKYGVHLKAEPDFMVLGKRLKADSKVVAKAVRELNDGQVEEFQKKGEMVVHGHTLTLEDIRIVYAFDQNSNQESKYEAHSDNDVLVLIDVTPDQSMLDEGVAREVINRIQKLRKKGKLVPVDDITVFYEVSPSGEYLAKVVSDHREYITSTIKQPLQPYPVPSDSEVVVQESVQLKGANLSLTIVRGHVGDTDANESELGPFCRYINVHLPDSNGKATVLLENPRGKRTTNLLKQIKIISNQNGNIKVFEATKAASGNEEAPGQEIFLDKEQDVFSFHASTVFASTGSSRPASAVPIMNEPFCRYVNVELCDASSQEGVKGHRATILLENPQGEFPVTVAELLKQCGIVFGHQGRKLKLYQKRNKSDEVSQETLKDVFSLHGSTLYASNK
ncbi:isoleucine--tRNA ligase, cytoplasmic-like [Ptychodera flava]|uniref:isoleucine--tRNA ligase, cytoplasmic-like n=1 Tax=Ptychodera flava TaxID=63121 RepID=UPI00396A922E